MMLTLDILSGQETVYIKSCMQSTVLADHQVAACLGSTAGRAVTVAAVMKTKHVLHLFHMALEQVLQWFVRMFVTLVVEADLVWSELNL
jgi:hypothetical protein